MRTHKVISIDVKVLKVDKCDVQIQKLIKSAKQAVHTAYAPYSHFHVGAALLLEDGSIVTGSNQENVAYPSGLCAERVALFYASAQYPHQKILAIAITAMFENNVTEDVCTPCGACRQVMLQIENRHKQKMAVYMCGKDKIYYVESAKDLLPLSFSQLP